MLSKDRKYNTMPLSSFFFAIGSPYAINSLREACKQIHIIQASSPVPEEISARRSTLALDREDMHDRVSPILCRYHLVQLVKCRDELQRDIMTCRDIRFTCAKAASLGIPLDIAHPRVM